MGVPPHGMQCVVRREKLRLEQLFVKATVACFSVRSWKRLGQIIGIKVWFLSTRTLFVFLDLWNLGENSVPILQFQLKQINGARSVLLFLRFARYSLNLDEQNGWIDVTFAGSKRNRLNSRIEEVPDLNMSCLRYGSCRAGMKRLQYSVSVLLVFSRIRQC